MKHGLISTTLCHSTTRRLTCGFVKRFDTACQALVQQWLTKPQGEPDRESSQGAGQLGSLYSQSLIALKRLIPQLVQIEQIITDNGLLYSLITQMSFTVQMSCITKNQDGIQKPRMVVIMVFLKVDQNTYKKLMDTNKLIGVSSTTK